MFDVGGSSTESERIGTPEEVEWRKRRNQEYCDIEGCSRGDLEKLEMYKLACQPETSCAS